LLRKTVSGIMLTLLFIGMLTLAFNIQPAKAWTGTVYIRADGSIDPPDAPITTYDNVIYTLIDNITSSGDGIIVQRDNIIINGAGYTIQGSGDYPYSGIKISGRTNVTVANATIRGFYFGIYIEYSSNINVNGNIVLRVENGIAIERSSNNNIIENDIKDAKNGAGIGLVASDNNLISKNNLTEDPIGITLGLILRDGDGVSIGGCNSNFIVENNVQHCEGGIYLGGSSNNTIRKNNVRNCTVEGIMVWPIFEWSSTNNIIMENNLIKNKVGISIDCSNNNIYHNNLIDNNQQVEIDRAAPNVWDDGYPSGGNYWSDYNGTDLYSGSYQNITGSDGIGDTPYVIDADNQDRYPLIHPWSPLPVHNINTGLGYATIQEAINAPETMDGHTIFVEAGTYYEDVVVNKSLTLLGENKETTIIDGNYTGNVIVINAENVTLTSFTIIHSACSTMQRVYAGVIVEGVRRCNISNNKIRAHTSSTSIIVLNSSYNYIAENDLNANGMSIWLANSANNTICKNNMALNVGHGLYLTGCQNNTILENNITANEYAGIVVSGSSSNIFLKNNVSQNYWGVVLQSPLPYEPSNNKFYHNNFMNNSRQVYYAGIGTAWPNVWDDGYPSGGNYWSDYTGADLYSGPYQNETGSDGIGDVPYFIDENNVDHYPLMNPWTPAPPSPPTPPLLNATVDVNPQTLNLRSRGRWITACIELPEGYNVSDINVSSMLLNGTVPVDLNAPIAIGDYDEDGVPDLMVEFNRSETILYVLSEGVNYGNVTLTLSGKLAHGLPFEGSCIIAVSDLAGDVNCDGVVDIYDVVEACLSYGSKEGEPNWNPNANYAPPYDRIDIFDIVTIAYHYGETYP